VPMIIGGLVEGLLYVGNLSGHVFDAHDEAVLQRLADQAAIAMHNARLFADEQAARAAAQAAAHALRESEAVLQRAMEVGRNPRVVVYRAEFGPSASYYAWIAAGRPVHGIRAQ